MLRAVLRVPLFYKILIANAVIVVLGAVVGTTITRDYFRSGPEGFSPSAFVTLLALVGVAITVLVNALILRLALKPLKLLERTAARVRAGDLDARVPPSPVADRELERLAQTFNGMLDSLANYRQRLRDVAARALAAEEEERKRIARELHDDTAQALAALMLRLRLVRGQDDSEERARLVDELRQELGEALERIRLFARGLRPPALDELGLVPALESHARSLSEAAGIPVRVEADPVDGLLTPEAELALYRIAQEALSNAIRHAQPTTAEVQIRRVGDAVRLDVRDDGRGFRVAEAREGERPGLGLFGMEERAAYLGGKVEIHSTPGRGTVVRATIGTAEEPALRIANEEQDVGPAVDRV
ncbi:MAG TPA: sensor histidine kinase [Solirubrobacterales bacterium]